SSGPVSATGHPLNAAIAGDGFFAVQTRAGERYTRNGAFQVDQAGRLVTNAGDPVLTASGPLTLSPQDQATSISADGSIVA
ncbi:flagellar hook-basal body complex protein, partial [Klebsiella pneumoniae]|uniref:flagellar hook-basal body complex protein n=1 Tax=Klebsiella pneumoniae TaxID=573 RepID=UPI0013D4FF28